ncbi:hypothetical protein LTR28_011438 [Elasticomyces elasticus]|nr:hypothetical protein LTR28_011438 [Elasticomyces elasticus]
MATATVKLFYATLYELTKTGREEIINQFKYMSDEHTFVVACQFVRADDVYTVLAQVVGNYIEKEAVQAEEQGRPPNALRMADNRLDGCDSYAIHKSVESTDASKATCTKLDSSRSEGDNTLWKPASPYTDLSKVFSQEVIGIIAQLTECEMKLVREYRGIIIRGKDQSLTQRKLENIERNMRRVTPTTHTIETEGVRQKIRMIEMMDLPSDLLRRTLLPDDVAGMPIVRRLHLTLSPRMVTIDEDNDDFRICLDIGTGIESSNHDKPSIFDKILPLMAFSAVRRHDTNRTVSVTTLMNIPNAPSIDAEAQLYRSVDEAQDIAGWVSGMDVNHLESPDVAAQAPSDVWSGDQPLPQKSKVGRRRVPLDAPQPAAQPRR